MITFHTVQRRHALQPLIELMATYQDSAPVCSGWYATFSVQEVVPKLL